MFDRFREPQEPMEIGQCGLGSCSGEVYENDLVYLTSEGVYVHVSCFVEYAEQVIPAQKVYATREGGTPE